MPRITDHKKQRRKDDVHEIIRRTPNGLREIEISERLNLERRTVHNYLAELEREGKIYKDGVLWLFDAQGGTWIRQLELAADEAFVLYLAARLLVKQSDKHNETAVAALSRLAEVLKTDLPVSNDIFQAAQELRKREKRPQYESIFSTLAKAYLLKHPVLITYKPLYGQAFTTLFHIYLMEPSAIGYTIYVIGQSQQVQAMRSYKIERIEAAEILYNQSYTIPPDFAGLAMLNSAWSIMTGEQTLRVVLRFNQAVTPRVLETNWHPAQGYEKQDNGSLRWWVDVADVTDMKPWIRGWGADVEVLEPESLREDMKGHVRRAAETYGITTAAKDLTSRLLRLWGKTRKQDHTLFHPAFYHMLDVAHVAQQLLSSRATPRWRNALGRALNADPATLHEWLPYLITLHDLGKLSTPFQMLNPEQVTRLKREQFNFGKTEPRHATDDALRHPALGRLFLAHMGDSWPKNLAHAFLDMVSGHHGIYRGLKTGDQSTYDLVQEPAEWGELRQHAQTLLHNLLCQQWPAPLPDPSNVSAAIAALNGFCTLCDWLGSDENYFTPRPDTPLWEYLPHSRQQAYKRVAEADFFQLAISHAPTDFAELFGFAPRPLQAAIDHIPETLLHEPTLTIIEAPTGEGKTEAALALARRIAALRGTDEMYIALPTTATSNAMYDRLKKYLAENLYLPAEMVRLVHGQSFLKQDDLNVSPLGNGEKDDRSAENWFAPKKKALLAPIGVGTIDQAELSALNVRHNALRLIGLAGKTIILDEVHAYDTYMTTIIKRMLQWLAALGSSVILLSATLPTSRRRELAEAFAGHNNHFNDGYLHAYPNLLTIGRDGFYTPAEPIGVSEINSDKQITLSMEDWGEEDTAAQVQWLLAQVREGGCACWITNTVKRAQQLYEALPHEEGLEVHLLHGRFSPAQRQQLEAQIIGRYGKPSDQTHRPQRGIVIGTQVLEQSLDLDFDVMGTDLAPIDLLLQRAGRLHRHKREDQRPRQHATAILYLNQTMSKADKAIYSEYILTLTQQALAKRERLHLPVDYRPLVEDVYNAPKPSKKDPLYPLWDALDAEMYKLETNAQERLTAEPWANDIFYQSARLQGFGESEDSTGWSIAQTRWAERETITLLPLVHIENSATLAGVVGSPIVSLDQKATRENQLALLCHSIRISDVGLVKAIKAQSRPALFESALLKHTYPLWLIPDPEDETCFIGEAELSKPVRLHPELGLVI